jgi:predicted O-methyltransferase YrrM
LKYKLFARHKSGHGIHSPFVFKLISQTFRNKTGSDVVLMIEKIRKQALSSEIIINTLDLGAGSVKMKGNRRKVSDIAKYSSVPEKYGLLLSSLSTQFGGESIIEFGTSLGISTMYLSAGSPLSIVYTMEGSHEIAAIAERNFETAGFRKINVFNGSFNDMIPVILQKGIKPGIVFIDGDHRREAVIEHFGRMAEIAGDNTLIILDDIHYSHSMEEAWAEIREWKNVSTTIDIWRMGLVFFRKGMSRIHYNVRY